MERNSFGELLTQKFLEWQKEEEVRKTVIQFAEFIGLGHKTISHSLNSSRPPSKKTVEHLAVFFHDPRFYDAASMDRPGRMTSYIRRNLGVAPDEVKKKIAEELSQYSSEPLPKDDEGNNGSENK